ncbi:MAG: helix-turn-helix transcriptional regulator [Nannocystaceae bacterium]
MDTEEIRARVAARIREVCARRKLSLNQLADRANVTRSLLYAVLSGERTATTDTLTRLAIALDVDPVELLRPARRRPKSSASDST